MLIKKQYKIEKNLGKGAMGEVYQAMDLKNNRPVALKCIKTFSDIAQIKRFTREYEFLSKINHHNVVKCYDFFEDNKAFYLVLELINGITLNDLILDYAHKFSFLEQLAIACQLTKSIEILHTKRIIHRDIKPSNIMLEPKKGIVKILDLGVGKNTIAVNTQLTETGGLIGTPSYMSPEQLIGERLSLQSDIFSLAVVLYQFFLWLPTSPFKGENFYETTRKLRHEPLPPLVDKIENKVRSLQRAYKDVSRVLQRALIKKPSHREITAAEFHSELEKIYRDCNNKIAKKKTVWQLAENTQQQNFRRKSTISKTQTGAIKTFLALTILFVLFLTYKFTNTVPQKRQLPKKMKKAKKFTQKDLEKINSIGTKYLKGDGVDKNYKKALRHYHKAAMLKYPPAMNNIGGMYYAGLGVRQNYTEAFIWFRKAAKLGDAKSMNFLGMMYQQGDGVEKSHKKSEHWFRKAAALNSCEAICMLGHIHLRDKNYGRALEYYQKAADLKHPHAMTLVGYMHEKGYGIDKSLEKAAEWFFKAAALNDHQAIFKLGHMYYLGYGLEKDHSKAKKWFEKALRGGNKRATKYLRMIERSNK